MKKIKYDKIIVVFFIHDKTMFTDVFAEVKKPLIVGFLEPFYVKLTYWTWLI